MKTQHIVQDYYGASYLLDADPNKDLIVFIVDDNPVYLGLLKKLIKRPNRTVYSFKIGEDCLDSLELKPDLVILDYHLDGVNPGVMKGNQIADIIHERSPETEIIIVSSDKKFKLLTDLRLSQSKDIMYKDKEALKAVKDRAKKLVTKNVNHKNLKRSHKVAFAFTILALAVLIGIILLIIKYYG